jgi:hypothetical protein
VVSGRWAGGVWKLCGRVARKSGLLFWGGWCRVVRALVTQAVARDLAQVK